MRRRRPLRHLAEIVRALAVVALVFLNFGPGLSQAAPHGHAAVEAPCSDAHIGHGTGHSDHHDFPCHACRSGDVAVLPPQDVSIDLDLAVADEMVFAAPPALLQGRAPPYTGSPRGPPAEA